MSIEAPVSSYKKNTNKILIVFLLAVGIYSIYDGYYNTKFIEKHKDAQGNPDSTLVFNQKGPPFLIGGAVLLGIHLFLMRNKKVIAGDDGILVDGKQKVLYSSIESLDKTYFEKKGYFVISYKAEGGGSGELKLSDRTYDKLGLVLDEIVRKIS